MKTSRVSSLCERRISAACEGSGGKKTIDEDRFTMLSMYSSSAWSLSQLIPIS